MAKLKIRYQEDLLEAGVDEAGRGCLAGPVSPRPSSAAHLSSPLRTTQTEFRRRTGTCCGTISRKIALAWSVAEIRQAVIDDINILQATGPGHAPGLLTGLHASGTPANRWKPFFCRIPHTPPMHYRRRRAVPLHSSGFDSAKTYRGRPHAPAAWRVSDVWLGPQQRIRNPGAP